MSEKFDKGKLLKVGNLIRCDTREQMREVIDYIEKVTSQKWAGWYERNINKDRDVACRYMDFGADNVYIQEDIEDYHTVLEYEDILLPVTEVPTKNTINKGNIRCLDAVKLETHLIKCSNNQQVRELLTYMADGDSEELTEWRRWYQSTDVPISYLFDVSETTFYSQSSSYAKEQYHVNFEDIFRYEDGPLEDSKDETLKNKPTKQIKKEKGKKMKTITKITTAVTTEVKALANERGAADIIKGKVLYSNVTKVFGRTIVKIPLADRLVAKVSKKMRFKNEVVQLGATLVALVAVKQFYDHDLIANVRGYIVHRLYEIAVEASGIDDVVALVQSHLPTSSEETKV